MSFKTFESSIETLGSSHSKLGNKGVFARLLFHTIWSSLPAGFSLNHGLKIRIACIVSNGAKLCSKYNTRVVLWLFFLLCAWPSSLPRAKLCSKFKCSSDFFGQQPRRYYYLYCMRNPLCYLAPDRYYLSRCWRASLLLRHVRNFLSLHISSFIV